MRRRGGRGSRSKTWFAHGLFSSPTLNSSTTWLAPSTPRPRLPRVTSGGVSCSLFSSYHYNEWLQQAEHRCLCTVADARSHIYSRHQEFTEDQKKANKLEYSRESKQRASAAECARKLAAGEKARSKSMNAVDLRDQREGKE